VVLKSDRAQAFTFNITIATSPLQREAGQHWHSLVKHTGKLGVTTRLDCVHEQPTLPASYSGRTHILCRLHHILEPGNIIIVTLLLVLVVHSLLATTTTLFLPPLPPLSTATSTSTTAILDLQNGPEWTPQQ
jgi:hypothetical protein